MRRKIEIKDSHESIRSSRRIIIASGGGGDAFKNVLVVQFPTPLFATLLACHGGATRAPAPVNLRGVVSTSCFTVFHQIISASFFI